MVHIPRWLQNGQKFIIFDEHVVCASTYERLGSAATHCLFSWSIICHLERTERKKQRFLPGSFLHFICFIHMYCYYYLRRLISVSFQCSHFCFSSSRPFSVRRLSGHMSNGNTHPIHWQWTGWASENSLQIYSVVQNEEVAKAKNDESESRESQRE